MRPPELETGIRKALFIEYVYSVLRKLNASHMREYRKIVRDNASLKHQNKPQMKLPRIPYGMSKPVARFMKTESARKSKIRSLPPKEWAKRVEKLPSQWRIPTACIIWWDFFGHRRAKQRWPQLDSWIHEHWHPIEEMDLCEALWRCGYTEMQAYTRSRSKATRAEEYEETHR